MEDNMKEITKKREKLFKEALTYVHETIEPIKNGTKKIIGNQLYMIGDEVEKIIKDFIQGGLFDHDEGLKQRMKNYQYKLDRGTEKEVWETLIGFSNYIKIVEESLDKKSSEGLLFKTTKPVVFSEGERHLMLSYLKSVVGIGLSIKMLTYENTGGDIFDILIGNDLVWMEDLLEHYSQDEKLRRLPAKIYLVMEGEPYLED